MPYDEDLAERLRQLLETGELVAASKVTEKKMFGGIAFFISNNMCVGVIREELMARVGPDAYEKLLEEEHAREMDFSHRPMRGFIQVGAEGVESQRQLKAWVRRCVRFAASLPPK